MSEPPTSDSGGETAKAPAARFDFSSPPFHPPFQQASPLGGVQTVVQIAQERHSGPLPAPVDFRQYKEVEPRAPGLILDMAVRQQKHEIWMDRATLISETIYRTFGILAATGVVGGMIAGSVYCAVNNQSAAAVALGAASGLATVAGVFIRGRNLTHMQEQQEPPARPSEAKAKSRPDHV